MRLAAFTVLTMLALARAAPVSDPLNIAAHDLLKSFEGSTPGEQQRFVSSHCPDLTAAKITYAATTEPDISALLQDHGVTVAKNIAMIPGVLVSRALRVIGLGLSRIPPVCISLLTLITHPNLSTQIPMNSLFLLAAALTTISIVGGAPVDVALRDSAQPFPIFEATIAQLTTAGTIPLGMRPGLGAAQLSVVGGGAMSVRQGDVNHIASRDDEVTLGDQSLDRIMAALFKSMGEVRVGLQKNVDGTLSRRGGRRGPPAMHPLVR
ncbi:hypothetical protein DFH09DRAFT_1451151 [Mycena vulgaris]|nr:hypothetical protein DFH09DRAFT_1451151 [Mycena vulgaris]